MSAAFSLAVEIWGARGSMPTPGAGTLRYGGNTTCISVRSAAGDRVVIDAGTGARKLGRELVRGGSGTEVNLFLTHFHWDHIQGLPFFAPLIQPGNCVRFHAGVGAGEIRARLERQMSAPFFTLDFHAAKAEREYLQIARGAAARCGGLTVKAFPLNHPQGAWGYRIEGGGASVVVATDVEHGNAELDGVLCEESAGADLLIYDAQYTDAEYQHRKGWGHSTAHAGVEAAVKAGVKELLLFHHDPDHDDEEMDRIVRETRGAFGATCGAREGDTVFLKGTTPAG